VPVILYLIARNYLRTRLAFKAAATPIPLGEGSGHFGEIRVD
jgi:hypothetical protein